MSRVGKGPSTDLLTLRRLDRCGHRSGPSCTDAFPLPYQHHRGAAKASSRLERCEHILARSAFRHRPLLLGFHEIEQLVDGLAKQSGSAGYPPYNIERIRPDSDESGDILRITLAVAGFALDDLEIQVEGRDLTISGRQSGRENANFLHRGIAARPFRRGFTLGPGLEVESADLENGLLSINLTMSETAPQQVRIATRG